MKIEIDQDYINWVLLNTPEGKDIETTDRSKNRTAMLTDYINEVLWKHRDSWENGEAFNQD